MLFRRAPTVLRPGSHDLAVSLALATLPQPLIAGLLRRMTRGLPQRYPKLATRLAELKGKRLLIVPEELPYAFLLEFPDGQFAIELLDPEQAPPTDAQMRGPLRLFYDLVRGGRDGDALFFSRELAVTGDMAAAVTLRNAMDGSGVDLFAEFLDLPGLLGPVVRGAGAVVDRWAGILLGPIAERAARLEGDVAALRSEVRRLKEGAAKPRPKPVSALAAAYGTNGSATNGQGAKP
jgi:predicted lipid carrier protein YhbT